MSMLFWFRRNSLPVFVMLVAACLAPVTHADSLDELSGLIADGKAEDAWAMAQRMEDEHAGDPEFDFNYGLAAVEAKHPERAVFAFERVHVAQPGNARVKLELARAYYMTGNNAQAKRLFNEVLAVTPPTNVERSIRNYLDAIDANESRSGVQVSGSVRIAAGYDTNTNSATDSQLNDFGPLQVTVGSGNMEQEAGFMDTRVGVDLTRPVNRRTVQFLSATVHARDNDEVFSGGDFDTQEGILTAGVMLRRGAATWRIPVTLQSLAIDSDEARYTGSVGVEYNRPQTTSRSLLAFAQVGDTVYPSNDARDTYTLLLGGGWNWNIDSWRLTAMGYVGTDPAQDSDFKFNGRDYVGGRASASRALSPVHSVYGNLGVQQSRYQEALVFRREDFLTDAAIGWQWRIAPTLALNADVSWTLNESADNTLFDYDRTQASIAATWRF